MHITSVKNDIISVFYHFSSGLRVCKKLKFACTLRRGRFNLEIIEISRKLSYSVKSIVANKSEATDCRYSLLKIKYTYIIERSIVRSYNGCI